MSRKRDTTPPSVPEPLPVPTVDAHTHLDACGARTREDVAAILDRAEAVGIGRVITVADDLESARWVVAASEWDERVFGAVALHPTRTADFTDDQRQELATLAKAPRVVAVGETGLDYYWDHAPPAAQHEAFRWHIALAKDVGKALMIHDRDAHEDILRILAEEGAPETVVFHCFSGDADFARRCAEAGYLLSFAGTVTFRNAAYLREAAAAVPVEQLLVETDAPFLTPHPFRGRPNEPYCAAYTVRELARVRGLDEGELAGMLTANAERAFRLRSVNSTSPVVTDE
ncbi:TatD DNase family protein [Actinoalloteichus hoggarensis]|uniref:Putative deoxyribonuclease YcfH n=1 Tax=Actinoalloteichus hoggarensis TaxID=1470176 RepID=A0A221VXW7_9PSEU|nr:TatD family hydrolase [Actinoalloteichus hoggarensis]ASO18317.1 putative deoxyribonuclease YcfH [Actinoalloteichus hoggarensis]MBB5921679.1 TatD DNase family protein [Actinoalloteichus hoggarensis]